MVAMVAMILIGAVVVAGFTHLDVMSQERAVEIERNRARALAALEMALAADHERTIARERAFRIAV